MDSYKLHWDIVEKIYDRNLKEIYIVKNISNENDKLILKVGKNVDDELHIIRKYGHIFLNSPYFGLSYINRTKYWDLNWFIMNKYDSNLEMDIDFGKKYINILIEDVIESIKAIHKYGYVHMDMKIQNILIDKTNKRFILSDYELMEEISLNKTKLIEEDNDRVMYYLSRGVRINDTIVSFKSDLICFGNVLWRVIDDKLVMNLERECEKIRKKEEITNSEICDMSDLQDEMYEAIPKELLEYYEKVFDIGDEWEPTEEYYEDLKKCLLRGINK